MNPRRQLYWLISIRLVATTSMGLPYLLYLPGISTSQSSKLLYILAGSSYLLSFLYLLALRFIRYRYPLQTLCQLLGDLILITGLVYYFGGASSAFSLLYLIVIAVASSLLPRRTGLIVANLAWFLYATVVFGLSYGWIQPINDQVLQPALLLYSLIIHILGFNTVAMLVSYVASKASAVRLELEEKEADFAKLEGFHRDITDTISSGLITTDKDGLVITINRAGAQILGRRAADAIGRPIFEIGVCSEEEWRRVAKITTFYGIQREESRHVAEGSETYIGYSVTEVEAEGERAGGYIVIYQDVTRWHRMEQEIRMKDRMAAIGELSAGIAHEIRNPLAAISGSVQMLSSSMPQNESTRKLLDIIVSESRRLDRTIEGFLKFARPDERSEAPFDVAELLCENVELLKNSDQVSDDHSVDLELDPPSAHILGDRDHVSQIFWNLARNALSAMPDGGRLLVRGKASEGSYRIEFCDNGKGMTEEERRTMFQPFKTSFQKGSGLGMAIVYRLVEEHGGELAVESELGRGTTVSIELPIGTIKPTQPLVPA